MGREEKKKWEIIEPETGNSGENQEIPQQEQEEVLARIEQSAESIRVPKSLEPEAVKKQLRAKKRRFPVRRMAGAAAALVVLVGGIGIYGRLAQTNSGTDRQETADVQDTDTENGVETGSSSQKQTEVGDYRLAVSYDEVYAAINAAQVSGYGYIEGDKGMESSIGASGETTDSVEYSAAADVAEAETDYSTTNLQTEGVDESDFVKNDGSYLYVQTNEQVSVIDIRGETMEEIAVITPEMDAADTIRDMYVADDRLCLILQRRNTSLESSQETSYVDDQAIVCCEEYETDTAMTTELQTYDISDRSKITCLGTVTQDGSYYTSRMVGDYVYLFSYVSLYDTEDIPEINGAQVEACSIYIQDDAGTELIISSVSLDDPEETVDQMVLMNSYAEIYMGTEAIYLYSYEYNRDWSASYTDITKFSYKDGYLDGVAAESVRGTIEDTFAISESDGILRVLTTEWCSDPSENQLYLLDENMQLLGSLSGIAAGEEIYAARYIGDIAYFITYHNTDPLFAVDISDTSNPVMLGQVEITGFSDYLHPYGDGLLLGIGYETDPDTSERLGVKLVMFDIADPTEPMVLDSVVIEGNYTSAAYDYKTALVSTARNLIGLEVTDYSSDICSYLLYSWNGEKFVEQLSEEIDDDVCYDDDTIRGLYAGDRFYLVSKASFAYQIRSYDMEDYQLLDELTVSQY